MNLFILKIVHIYTAVVLEELNTEVRRFDSCKYVRRCMIIGISNLTLNVFIKCHSMSQGEAYLGGYRFSCLNEENIYFNRNGVIF